MPFKIEHCNRSTKAMEAHQWEKTPVHQSILMYTHVLMGGRCPLLLALFSSTHLPFPSNIAPPTFLGHILCLSTSTILNKMGYHCKSSLEHGVCPLKHWQSWPLLPFPQTWCPTGHHSPLPYACPNTIAYNAWCTHMPLINSGQGYSIMYSTTQHSVHGSPTIGSPTSGPSCTQIRCKLATTPGTSHPLNLWPFPHRGLLP